MNKTWYKTLIVGIILFSNYSSLPVFGEGAFTGARVKEQIEAFENGPTGERIIGFTLRDCYEVLGIPDEVTVMRGEAVEKDVVVFFYEESLYLYWYDNRVWQVRYDERFSGDFRGIRIGMTRSEVLRTLAEPMIREWNLYVYSIDDRGFPIHMAVYFERSRVIDIYVYRADF